MFPMPDLGPGPGGFPGPNPGPYPGSGPFSGPGTGPAPSQGQTYQAKPPTRPPGKAKPPARPPAQTRPQGVQLNRRVKLHHIIIVFNYSESHNSQWQRQKSSLNNRLQIIIHVTKSTAMFACESVII